MGIQDMRDLVPGLWLAPLLEDIPSIPFSINDGISKCAEFSVLIALEAPEVLVHSALRLSGEDPRDTNLIGGALWRRFLKDRRDPREDTQTGEEIDRHISYSL